MEDQRLGAKQQGHILFFANKSAATKSINPDSYENNNNKSSPHYDNHNFKDKSAFYSQFEPVNSDSSKIDKSLYDKSECSQVSTVRSEFGNSKSNFYGKINSVKIECESHKSDGSPINKCRNICNVCKRIFNQKSDLEQHNKIHLNTKTHECIHCGEKFMMNVYLQHHLLKIHSAEKMYNCLKCKKSFEYVWRLEAHSRTTCDAHICQYCDWRYKSAHDLKMHLLKHNGTTIKQMLPQHFNTAQPNSSGHLPAHSSDLRIQKSQQSDLEGTSVSDIRPLGSPHLQTTIHNDITSQRFESAPLTHVEINSQQSDLEGTSVSDIRPLESPHLQTTLHNDITSQRFESAPLTHVEINSQQSDLESTSVSDIRPLESPHLQTTCPQCKIKFTSAHEVQKHQIMHGDHKCPQCDMRFRYAAGLAEHARSHSDNKCMHCDKVYKTLVSMKQHMLTKHGDLKTHLCQYCGLGFKLAKDLKKHINYTTPQSTECDSRLQSIQSLNIDLLARIGDISLECAICYRSFARVWNLKKHILTHGDIHKCPYCGARLTSRHLLKIHLFKHARIKIHQCPKCEKGFNSIQDLKGHQIVHTRKKVNICAICDRIVCNATDLKSHLISHSDVKLHQCPKCDKRFKHIGSVKTHLSAIHSGLKLHTCVICDKSFSLAKVLIVHLSTHSDIKSHKCPQCDSQFKSIYTLKMHIVNQHSNIVI